MLWGPAPAALEMVLCDEVAVAARFGRGSRGMLSGAAGDCALCCAAPSQDPPSEGGCWPSSRAIAAAGKGSYFSPHPR